MTGRTHDLCAFTAVNLILATQKLPHMTIGTAFAATVGALIGGIIPDLDQHTSNAWNHLPGGSIFGTFLSPLLGGHRNISHSLLGMAISGFIVYEILNFMTRFMQIDLTIVWSAVMLGQLSHLIADTFTTEGVPWLLPIKYRFGIPPFKHLRIKTGGFVEKVVVYPGLIILNAYLIVAYYSLYKAFFISLK